MMAYGGHNGCVESFNHALCHMLGLIRFDSVEVISPSGRGGQFSNLEMPLALVSVRRPGILSMCTCIIMTLQ